MSNNANRAKGVSFAGLLTILFIGLKLGGVINWAWFWVLFPILLPGLIFIVFGIIAFSVYLFNEINK